MIFLFFERKGYLISTLFVFLRRLSTNLNSSNMKRMTMKLGGLVRLAALFVALAFCMTGAAQRPYKYDSGHKYSLLSNWTVGVAGQYSNYHGASGVGISALATKRVDDLWRLRFEATMNGLRDVEGFDRYGTAMAGVSFDFLNWMYLFADAGAVINPTMATKCGLAGDAGLGLNVNFGKHSMLWLEGGSDLVQHNASWDNTFFARLGYSARLGITEGDRVAIDIDNNMRNTYGEIKQENALLKSEAKKKDEDNARLTDLLERSTAALELATQRLSNCQSEVQQVTENCANMGDELMPIFFDYASAEITPIEDAKIERIANYINTHGGEYRVEGYSSPDGNSYNNQKLSGERAFVVYQALMGYGVPQDRLIPMANGVTSQFGEESTLNRMVIVRKSEYGQ